MLLKPESDQGSQLVVRGQVAGRLEGDGFQSRHLELLDAVLESFELLQASADIIIVEGAGSPAETNLRQRDIANMGFATAANVPVVLAGDIDRGGVIASLVGTHTVLDDRDRAMIRGFLINKFRGEPSLFEPALTTITEHTGWPSLGVVSWHNGLARLPAEDAVVLEQPASEPDGESSTHTSVTGTQVTIAVPLLSRIANFDDLDPLRHEPNVEVRMVAPGQPLPAADVVILPGTKNTIAELDFFRAQGWHDDLTGHVRRGGAVIGLCGGYQMLGLKVSDPDGVEGAARTVPGLGLLDIETMLERGKVTRSVSGRHLESGTRVAGYEIHVGRTSGPDTNHPWLQLDRDNGTLGEGAMNADGTVVGAYVHGVFESDDFRRHMLGAWGVSFGPSHHLAVEAALDGWAEHLATCLDIDQLQYIAYQS